MKRKPASEDGFTIIEILVAVVVLSVGLLGMAAMTIMVIRGNSMAVRQTSATNIAQAEMERLKDVGYDDLGTDVSCDTTSLSRGVLGSVCRVSDIDAEGNQVATNDPNGIYNAFLMICDSTVAAAIAGTLEDVEDRCTLTSAADPVVPELACEPGSLNPGEKQIRVMVSWNDSNLGRCRNVPLETVLVQP